MRRNLKTDMEMVSNEAKSILKYPGAKTRIAPWILSFIPECKVYLEPFFGSGAVFFQKPPCKHETINDLDGEVYNLFCTIRNYPDELARLVEMTPYSREEYEKDYIKNTDDTDLERARKFITRCWQGMGSSNVYKNGFRSSQQGSSPKTTEHWKELPERILASADRLKHAQIENLDAIELIKRYNTPDVFIYLDPPYLPGTRKGYLYTQEMTEMQHIELLETIVKHPGKVLISGYDNDLYNKILNGWKKVQKTTQAENGLKRTETLWMNELKAYAEPEDEQIWDGYHKHYSLIWSTASEVIKVHFSEIYMRGGLYFKTKKIAEQAVEAVGEDRVKKYYLHI